MSDNTVALNVKGYDPADVLAPLQAYSQLMQGENYDAEAQSRRIANQQNQLSLDARQSYANTLRTPGADLTAGLAASGLGAYDPEGTKTALGNIQAGNTLNALKSYTANPSNPGALAPAGPEAVGQASTALGTQATTAATQQDIARQRQDQIGQVALGFLNSDRSESARQLALAQAHNSSLFIDPRTGGFNNLLYHQFATMPLSEFTARAQQLVSAGAGSVQTSGAAEGAITRAHDGNRMYTVSPGEALYAAPGLQGAMFNSTPTASQGGGGGNQPPSGRSVANDATPSQPPMMTQAENAHNLPGGWLGTTSHIESRGNPTARSPSGAMGLMQIMPDTWRQYARPGQNPYNPQDSIEVGSRIAADYQNQMTKALGRPPTGGELYLGFQQGAGGAIGLLRNPNAPAASIVGAKAVIANGGTPSMSAGQFANMWVNRFNKQGGSNFTLSGGSPMGAGVQMPSAPQAPAAALPAAGMVGLRAAAGVTPPQPDLMPPAASAPAAPAAPAAAAAPVDTQGRSSSDDALPPTRSLMPAAAGGLTPVVQGMSPAQLEEQRTSGRMLGELPQQYALAASSAKAQNTTLDQMADDAQRFRMGRGADFEQEIHAKIEGLAKYFNTPTPEIDKQLGAYQSFTKASGQIARQAASSISPIVGVHELAMVSGSLPNPEMSQNGFSQVKAILQGSNDFTIAKQQAAEKYKFENKTLDGFESDWTRNADPSAFWARRMDSSSLRTMATNLQKSPEGRVTLKRMMAGMQWLRQKGLYE